MFRDSAASDSRMRATDASQGSDVNAGNRPGFRIATLMPISPTSSRTRAAYLDYITNAYKQPQRVRDQDTPAGEPGSVDHDELPDRHRFDGMTVEQISRCHQQNMRRIYDQIDDYITNAWHTKPARV